MRGDETIQGMLSMPGTMEAARPSGVIQHPRPRLVVHRSADAELPAEWLPIVTRLGLTDTTIGMLLRRSIANATTFQIELFSSGLVPEGVICREIAREVGLQLIRTVRADRLIMQPADLRLGLRARHGLPHAMLREAGGLTVLLLSPAALDLAELHRIVTKWPGLLDRVRIVVPSALRTAMIEASRGDLDLSARSSLFVERPHLSARIVLHGWQGALIGMLAVGLPVGFWLDWPATWLAIHVVFSVFFLACVWLRLAAALSARPVPLAPLQPVRNSDLPVYTVLVALYREARIVPQLIAALSRLRWPRSKLEIKLVCEADDHETLQALRAMRLRPCVEIIEVPPGEPRTKPKALAYALPLCSGEFITLYDAEDHPHPQQLIEAWQRFRASDDRLACLQAPLGVVPSQTGLLPRLFAFEYAGLFRGLLPWLSRHRLILPLGGTSNHFRRTALEKVGAWDPCNVTEDADLGLRLARHGYRSETITRPTLEDAPEELLNWGRQRTRWFKGWMQTWLVHMRNPRRLLGEVGLIRFAVAQLLLGGMIVSALAQIVFVGTLVWIAVLAAGGAAIGSYHAVLLIIDAVNVLIGYTAFLVLGWRTLKPSEHARYRSAILWIPAYWLAISLAAWRAIWELYRRPHHWEKTDHPLRQKPSR